MNPRPLILLFFFAGALSLSAADSSEQFLSAYQSFQQGEKLERSGNTDEAVSKYRYAESLLQAISKNDPSWQKPVVEYRLKKTRENLDRLQAAPSGQTSAAVDESSARDTVSPVTQGPSITIVPPTGTESKSVRSSADSSADVRRLRRQIDELKNQLQEARDALSAQKSRLGDLENAEWVKKRSEMSQELDLARRRISDLERDLKARSSWAKDLKDLQKKLDETVADKLAAEEQYQQSARRAAEENASLAKKLREAGEKLTQSVESKQKIEQLTKEVENGKEAMEQLRAKLGHSEEVANAAAEKNAELKKQYGQVTVQLATLQKQLDASAKTARAAGEEAAKKAAASEADRAALEEERERLLAKVDQAAKTLASLKQEGAATAPLRNELDQVKAQLAENTRSLDLAKSKLAESEQLAASDRAQADRRAQASETLKNLLQQQNNSLQDQLKVALAKVATMADQGPDSASLQEKLKTLQGQVEANARNYDESRKQLEDLSKARPEQEKALQQKEKDLADARRAAEKLQSDLSAANQRIAALQQQSGKGEDRLRDLQEQLASRDSEIARLKKKKGGASAVDEKTVEENTLLRGIVLREIKEEAKRSQARRLMEEELKRLNVQSQSLSEQITVLSSPVIELTPQERALFKEAQLVVTEGAPEKIQASIAAPIVPEGQKVPSSAGEQQPQPKPSESASAEIPWQGKFKEILARAKQEFDRQDYLQAENSFQEALQLSPNDFFALSNLGVVQFQLGKMKEAEESLKKASEKSSESSFALTTLGIVHYRQERLGDAENVLRKAISVNPQDFTAHNYLGIVLAASGKGRAGESEIMKAIEINPQYADAHFNLAVIYATGKPPSKILARKHYKRAVDLGAPPDLSLENLIQ